MTVRHWWGRMIRPVPDMGDQLGSPGDCRFVKGRIYTFFCNGLCEPLYWFFWVVLTIFFISVSDLNLFLDCVTSSNPLFISVCDFNTFLDFCQLFLPPPPPSPLFGGGWRLACETELLLCEPEQSFLSLWYTEFNISKNEYNTLLWPEYVL